MSFPSTIEPAESSIILDIRSRVDTAGNEEGLLGLVFDLKFEANGYFYVYYSAGGPGRSVVSRFTQRDGVAVPESELGRILRIDVPVLTPVRDTACRPTTPLRAPRTPEARFGPIG